MSARHGPAGERPEATRPRLCANPVCRAPIGPGDGSIEIGQDGASWRLCGLDCALGYLRLCAARHDAVARRQAEAGR